MKTRIFRRLVAVPVLVLAVQALAPAAGASHSWETYHWARAESPLTLTLADNLTSVWRPHLATTSTDWSASSVVDTSVTAGSTRNSKRCAATLGRVEVCNSTYGRNDWLGLAQVWINPDNHILQGTVKLNDTYFNTARYNTPAWRSSVMCQEVGHTLGLDHQDEDFNTDLKSCMDYSNVPFPSPNDHDYQVLASIYSHTDSSTTVSPSSKSGSVAADVHAQDEWGQAVRYAPNGRPVLFVRVLSGNVKHFTWVTWAE